MSDVQKEIVDDLKRILEIHPDAEVDEALLNLYEKHRKRKSICGLGDVTGSELVLLATVYDFVKSNKQDAISTLAITDSTFSAVGPPTEIIEKDIDEKHEFKKDDKVIVMSKGTKVPGTFLSYVNDELCRVKLDGDNKRNYRKVDISDVGLYKEE